MMREHERVVLTRDVPAEGLKQGDVGTVVHLYRGEAAYEVEFVALDGETVAIVTLAAQDVRPVGPGEMQHARTLESRT
jgi:ATP-dependent exoDNAse (exonuclease V) alpha subunit